VLYPALAAAILLTLTLALHLITRRQVRALRDEVERLRRQAEVLDSRQRGPPPAAQTRPGTARFTPSGTRRLPDPSPTATARLPDPSPHANKRLPEPSPRGVPLPPEPTPRGTARAPDLSPRSTPKVADASDWAPTHRITFTPDQGRAESWLVMIRGGIGGRVGATKAEWSAAVDPAWQCGADNVWTYRGQRTPDSRRGVVKVEEFRG
jgi:hypothetical protein